MRFLPPCPPWVALPLMLLLLLAANVLSGARQCLAYTDPVLPGQTVTGETLGEWCDQWVFGTANYTSITIGGVQWVYPGGVSNYTTISGGGQGVKSGGVANYTTLNGAIVNVEDGGVVNHATLNSGDLNVYSGGVSNYTVINGGIEYIYSGATSNYATISGGMQQVSGTANYATLNSGTQYVTSGGLADNTTINGGTQNVLSGGTATNTTINGGTQNVSGTAATTTINGGVQNVQSGGSATNTTIAGGTQNVQSGGLTNTTIINSGTQNVAGTAISTTINGGTQNVSGKAQITTINGGTQNVLAGGFALSSTVNSGGALSLASGGILAGNTRISGTGLFTAAGDVINRGSLIFDNSDARSYAFNVTGDNVGSGGMVKSGTGSLTLTGNTTQALGITLQGGGLTLTGGTHTVGFAPSLTLSGGSAEMHATLNGVTLNPTGDLFAVNGATNPANTLTLNGMTLSQPLTATAGNGLLVYGSNGGSVGLTANASTLQGVLQFDSTGRNSLSLASGSVLTGTVSGGPDMTIGSGSRFVMTGSSNVGNLAVAGDLVFRNDGEPFTPKALVVTGITGAQGLSGGTVTLNTVLSNNPSLTDCIIVNGGTVTGTTRLYINNVGGLGASTTGTSGIAVVLASNGANTAARLVDPGFYLANGPLQAGAYTYSLRPGDLYGQGQSWYLTTDYVPAMTFTNTASGSSGGGAAGASARSGTTTAAGYTGGRIVIAGSDTSTLTVANVSIGSTGATGQAGSLILLLNATSAGNTVTFDTVTATLGGGLLIAASGGSNLNFTATGSTLTGNIVFDNTSQGTVNLVNGTALTGWIDPVSLFIDSTSKWVMTADSQLNNLTLAGNISFDTPTGSFTPKTLTVNSLTGRGGTITLNTSLGGDNSPSDKIVVDGGSVTGTTKLAINNMGGLGAQTVGNGIMVVQALNGADTTAQSTRAGFTLGAPVYAGSYMYYLRPGDILGQGQDWYLSSTASGFSGRTAYRPDDALLASVMGLGHDLMQATLGTYSVREGEGVNRMASSSGLSAWTRGLGSVMRREGGGTVSPGYEAYTDGFQLGAQLDSVSADGDKRAVGVYGAMMYGNGWAWGDSGGARFTHVGNMDMTATSAGLYGTYQWAGKGYVDAALQGSLLSGHSYGTRNAKVTGYGWAASLSGGYPFRLGDSGFTLEPQAQGIYQQAHFDGVDLASTHASLKGGSRTTLRGGARLKYDTTTESGVRWMPSLSVNLRHDEDTDAKVTMSTASASTGLPTNFSGTFAELVGGLTVQVNDRFSLYGQVGGFTSVDGKSSRGAQGSVGLKISF